MQGQRRWKAVALISLGLAGGIVLAGTPAGAHVASWTHNWTNHIRPKADARYYTKTQANARFLPGGNLAPGKTIRGAYLVGGSAPGAGTLFVTDISYGWTMRTGLTEHYIQDGEANPAGCAGNEDFPRASPGHLCVFEQGSLNAESREVQQITTGRFGTRVYVFSAGSGQTEIRGTWAATAPLAAAPRPASAVSSRATGR
jgi:hypothetical protein